MTDINLSATAGRGQAAGVGLVRIFFIIFLGGWGWGGVGGVGGGGGGVINTHVLYASLDLWTE